MSKDKKSSTHGCLGVALLGAIVLLLAVYRPGCDGTPPGGGRNPAVAEAIRAVRRSLTAAVSVSRFEAGPLRGGTAVLVDDMAAYGVKDGKVHGANGYALMWSECIDRAPAGISMPQVRAACRP